MYSSLLTSRMGRTPGHYGELPSSHTSMGYGSGCRSPVIRWEITTLFLPTPQKALTPPHPPVTNIAPPTECSLAVLMPSAQLSHKGGASVHPKGSIRNVKVHPRSSDPPGNWSTWEEFIQLKPGELTPDQIVTVVT